MKNLFNKLATLGFAIGSLFAIDANAQSLNKIPDFSKIDTPENQKAYHKQLFNRVPNKQYLKDTQVPMQKGGETFQSPYKYQQEDLNLLDKLPEDAVFPGEFEELEGVLVWFPYAAIDSTLSYVLSPLVDNYGEFLNNKTGKPELTPIAYYVPEFLVFKEDTRFTDLYVDLIHAIQNETTAYVVIGDPQDTVEIKKYAESKGKPFNNVKWISYITNSFWFRDCGAIGFYYDNLDKIGLLDFEYYSGRPLDDDINYPLSDLTEYPIYKSTIELEGGNILVDGYGKLITSDHYYLSNRDSYGQIYMTEDGRVTFRQKNST